MCSAYDDLAACLSVGDEVDACWAGGEVLHLFGGTYERSCRIEDAECTSVGRECADTSVGGCGAEGERCGGGNCLYAVRFGLVEADVVKEEVFAVCCGAGLEGIVPGFQMTSPSLM